MALFERKASLSIFKSILKIKTEGASEKSLQEFLFASGLEFEKICEDPQNRENYNNWRKLRQKDLDVEEMAAFYKFYEDAKKTPDALPELEAGPVSNILYKGIICFFDAIFFTES